MKRISAFLLAAAVAASSFTAVLAAENDVDEAGTEAAPAATETVTAGPTETVSAVPDATAEPDVTGVPDASSEPASSAGPDAADVPDTTEEPGAVTTSEPGETPTAEPTATAEPTPDPDASPAPVYVIRNSGNILFTYENGGYTAERMTASNGSAVSMKNNTGSNFVPFRYLFEKFGVKDLTAELGLSTNITGIDGSVFGDREGFIWGYVNDVLNIIIKEGENVYTVADGQPIEALRNTVADKVFVDGGNTYIPLRAVSLVGYNVVYDGETDSIFISENTLQNGTEYTERMSGAKSGYTDMINYSYSAGAYAYYDTAGGAVSALTDDQGRRTYSVNRLANILVYVDADKHAKISLTGSAADAQDITFDNTYVPLIGQIIYDGKKLYGIKLDTADSAYGMMFSADLECNADGGFYATNIRYIPGVSASDLLLRAVGTDSGGTTSYRRWLYFVDASDWNTVKRVDMTYWTMQTVAAETSEGPSTLSAVLDFNVAGGYMIYNQNNMINVAKLTGDGSRVTVIGEPIQVGNGTSGMIADADAGSGALFYFVGNSNAEGSLSKVYAVNVSDTEVGMPCVYDGGGSGEVKVSGIALFDDVLYGVINDGVYTRLYG